MSGLMAQDCPDCGRSEAKGAYCTKCFRPMGPADWHKQGSGRPARVAAEGPKTPQKGGRNREVASGAAYVQ